MWRKSNKARSGRSGVSLAEVMVAMFVMVVGIAGVTSTIWWGSQKSDSGKLIQEASDIGRIVVETLFSRQTILTSASPAPPSWFGAASGLFDDPPIRRQLDAPPLGGNLPITHIQNTILNTQSDVDRFTRNIRCTRMDAAGSGLYGEELCTLKVTIFWQEKRSTANPTLAEHHVTHELVMPHKRDVN